MSKLTVKYRGPQRIQVVGPPEVFDRMHEGLTVLGAHMDDRAAAKDHVPPQFSPEARDTLRGCIPRYDSGRPRPTLETTLSPYALDVVIEGLGYAAREASRVGAVMPPDLRPQLAAREAACRTLIKALAQPVGANALAETVTTSVEDVTTSQMAGSPPEEFVPTDAVSPNGSLATV